MLKENISPKDLGNKTAFSEIAHSIYLSSNWHYYSQCANQRVCKLGQEQEMGGAGGLGVFGQEVKHSGFKTWRKNSNTTKVRFANLEIILGRALKM